jgi:hypothetical protein
LLEVGEEVEVNRKNRELEHDGETTEVNPPAVGIPNSTNTAAIWQTGAQEYEVATPMTNWTKTR